MKAYLVIIGLIITIAVAGTAATWFANPYSCEHEAALERLTAMDATQHPGRDIFVESRLASQAEQGGPITVEDLKAAMRSAYHEGQTSAIRFIFPIND